MSTHHTGGETEALDSDSHSEKEAEAMLESRLLTEGQVSSLSGSTGDTGDDGWGRGWMLLQKAKSSLGAVWTGGW